MTDKLYLYYYILVNSVLFILMGIDKLSAKLHKWRIKEATLLTISLIGGGLGGFLAMLIFNHKIRKKYFSIVFLFSILTHIIIYFSFVKIQL